MKVRKTVQGGVVNLTKVKRRILTEEYENLQKFLHRKRNVELYSANKQQAERYYKKIKDRKEYPISIRKDLINIQKCDSDICDYFVKIPVAGRWGGLKLPVNTHIEIEDDWEICESKLYSRDSRFYLNITVEIEVKEVKEYAGVLTGKGWHQREYNKVRDQLHKITTKIANYAKKNKLIVAVGNLSGIQKRDNGRKMNRKLHRFPHYSFRQMLKYKCEERGIKYIEVSEAYTSQLCSHSGEKGDRHDGLFKCPNCGQEIDADINGAINIVGRALGKPEIRPLVNVGVPVTVPRTLSREATSGTSTMGTISCRAIREPSL